MITELTTVQGQTVWINMTHIVSMVHNRNSNTVSLLTTTGVLYEITEKAGRAILDIMVEFVEVFRVDNEGVIAQARHSDDTLPACLGEDDDDEQEKGDDE